MPQSQARAEPEALDCRLFPRMTRAHCRTGKLLLHAARYHRCVVVRQHGGSGPASPQVPEPTLAERARTLALIGRIGSLCTHSHKFPGYPFGSLMPYVADSLGRPIFFISSLAMHTQNLQKNPRASLLITQPDVPGDPLGSARLTLLGEAGEAPVAEVKELYLSHHEDAKMWQDYSDFAYYRLAISGVYFIGGFGVMGWISPEDYASAVPDPLAEAAPAIIRHLNEQHSDALRLIARRFTGEEAEKATITAIDRLGFHLRLKSADGIRGRRIGFLREVRDVENARAVFVEMARQAT